MTTRDKHPDQKERAEEKKAKDDRSAQDILDSWDADKLRDITFRILDAVAEGDTKMDRKHAEAAKEAIKQKRTTFS